MNGVLVGCNLCSYTVLHIDAHKVMYIGESACFTTKEKHFIVLTLCYVDISFTYTMTGLSTFQQQISVT
jgi:hypothetical protein